MSVVKTIFKKVPGIFWGIILATILFSFAAPGFTKLANIENILKNASILMIVAIGMTLAILLGKIDISISGTMAAVGMVCAVYLTSMEEPTAVHVLIGVVIALVMGALLGSINGLFIGVLKYDYWLVTFSTMSITLGLAQIVTGGYLVAGFNKTVRFLGDGSIAGVSTLIYIAVILVAVMIVIMRNTRFGMHIYAIGDSEQCAQLSGVNVKWTIFAAYALSGMFAGLGGILLLSKTNSMGPTSTDSYAFNAIAAVIVGGTSFSGGKGGLGGTVLGALFITIIKAGLPLIGLSAYWQQACIGIFILAIIIVDVVGERVKMIQATRRVYHD